MALSQVTTTYEAVLWPQRITMTTLGTIAEILSSTVVLIRSDADFDVDDILIVFAEVPVQQFAEKYGLESLQYPKGEVSVLAKQDKGLYLAETFRPTVESHVVEKTPGLLSGLFPTEVIRKTAPGEPSAILAGVTTPVAVSKKVEVGDKVSRR
jgi:hypothetical protein